MRKNLIKLLIVLVLITGLLGSSFNPKAYPAFLKQASKFGAKNCLFCHKQPQGGEGWNERGLWLIAEKERRNADAIDVSWLSEYKEGENKGVEKKEADPAAKNEGEKEKQPTGEKEDDKLGEKGEKEAEKKVVEKEPEKEINKSEEKVDKKEGEKETEKVGEKEAEKEKETEKETEKATEKEGEK